MTAESDLIVGRYRLIERLGEGGAADVWRARDQQLGRPVAVKFLRADADEAFRQRFAGEGRRAAAVSHPNAVQVYDTVDNGVEPFIVMELVEGRSLEAILRARGGFPPTSVADIVTQIAGALDAAHEVGIIHCDVKPANILIDKRGTAKLTDFGIARPSGTERGDPVLGTARYIAPERLEGATATARTDVYGLGLVAYEMLGGRPAFDAGTGGQDLRGQILATSPRLDVEVAGINANIGDVVARALDRLPEQRYSSASGFANALAAAVRSSARTELLPRFVLHQRVVSLRSLGHLPLVIGVVLMLAVLTGIVSAARGSISVAVPPVRSAASTSADLRSSAVAAVTARTTPNVVGMPAKDAVSRLRERGFRNDVEIVVDTTAPGRKGTVLRQEPAAGASFQPGQRAKLVVVGRYDED